MTKEELLRLTAARYEERHALNKQDNVHDYEKEFVNIWQGLGRLDNQQKLDAINKTSLTPDAGKIPSWQNDRGLLRWLNSLGR